MDRAAANQPRFTRGRFVACVPDVNHQKKRGLNHEANFNEANFAEANYDTIDTTATSSAAAPADSTAGTTADSAAPADTTAGSTADSAASGGGAEGGVSAEKL